MLNKFSVLGMVAAVIGVGAASPAPRVHARAAPSPEALATQVMQVFSAGTADEFAAIYPDSAGRVFMREARGSRRTELAQVIWKEPHRAVLLLGGVVLPSGRASRSVTDGADETNGARHFSGFYEARDTADGWRIVHQIPLDSGNYVRSQRLHVIVTPSTGIQVLDTLDITVRAPYGFGVRLNSAVQLQDVSIDDAPAKYAFGGGVLWVNASVAEQSRLVLSYTLAASRSTRAGADNPAAPPPAYGAFHNTDVWHPFFDYLSANDLAQISATVQIPSEYYLTTTVPQTDTVRHGVRTVYARSVHPAFLLALIFDRDWRPRTTEYAGFRFESFTGPGFQYSHDSLATVTKRVYDVLTPRFGEPQSPSRYMAVVQDRTLGSGGFVVRINNAAVSGADGGQLGSPASQTFAHETGHAWTLNGTGRGSNFLHEAWATYVEALMLYAQYGANDEHTFWERQRDLYAVGNDRRGFTGGFEGNQSILGDYDNGTIHYRKGSWILYSGNYVMGDTAFDRGMHSYIDGLGKGPGGYEELIAAWSAAAGHSMSSFVMPWLTSRYIPDVEARLDDDGRRLIVTQVQPGELFDLPKLEIALTTAAGTSRQILHLSQRADTVNVEGLGVVTEVHVDPDYHFLLTRHWGESAVRFSLPVARTGNATRVTLGGDFLRSPIPATKSGDAWVVVLPMTEGRYTWVWQIGDAPPLMPDSTLTGLRTVRALERVTKAYPGR